MERQHPQHQGDLKALEAVGGVAKEVTVREFRGAVRKASAVGAVLEVHSL